MQSSPSSWRSALRAAVPHTIPIFAGFLVLGVTYGMLMQAIGYGPLWSGLFSAIAIEVWSDMLNTKVRNADEIEELLGLPVIGRMPAVKGGK